MRIIRFYFCCILLLGSITIMANPIHDLLERIDQGASKKFKIELIKSNKDFFELDQSGRKVVVRGNNYINIATGVNWYLKHYAGIHLSWNGMQAKLPKDLPQVNKKERRETDLKLRYNFNYCTYSYSMPFWDWERWEKEIDWMALHGINLPLAVVGQECVWFNMLGKLGYSKEEINQFISGPAFFAWWAMNNLEGWGGPNPDSWYTQQEALQKKILKRMRDLGMEPVFPGYSGMVPHDANEKLGLDVEGSGIWNGYVRPAFLAPTDKRFQEIAELYYKELESLYGKANYYSMDPFHESKAGDEVDFEASGKAIMNQMKKVNPKAVWVIQGWTENPRPAMIEKMQAGDLLILDLFSECRPMWGIESIWKREKGYEQHDWLFCMLLNFGGNVGLHGRMDQLLDNFYQTKTNPLANNLKGIGFTMEGIENNPIMFELMSELPWRPTKFTKEEWIKEYVFARYGIRDSKIEEAWQLLANTIYNCPAGNNQQGPHESIFCGRPSLNNFQVSSWSKMDNYYDPTVTEKAARLLIDVADKYRGNNNFEYDLVDIVRQAVADRGRIVYNYTIADFKSFNKESFKKNSQEFLDLLLMQDQLLGTRQEFRVGNWTQQARKLGNTREEKDLYEWNARVQITTWGNRECADNGKLRDYAHKEWNGILKDFYYKRWASYWKTLEDQLNGHPEVIIDFYAMEEPWTLETNPYTEEPEGDCVDVATEVFMKAFN
ncbi:MAG: alpha-N-acetylglucosaminidase [Bacteroidales bacterium]|nr:alpha-N-acetylglucosaminidase [Bacteroidales bacterium]